MKFFDLFPTPRFLSLAEAGISISDRAIRYIAFKPAGAGAWRRAFSGEVPLPEGVVSGGIVNDKSTLTTALLRMRKEHKMKFVRVAIPEDKAYLFTTSVDRLPYKDLKDAVAFTIEENAPVSLAKSVFSFEFIDKSTEVQAAVAVLPEEVVSAYTEAFEAAGLTPVSFDLESQAIAKSIIKRGDDRPQLIVHLGERKVGFYLVQDGIVKFSSTLAIDLPSLMTTDAVETLKSEIRKFFVFWEGKLTKDGRRGPAIEQVIVGGPKAADDLFVSNIMSEVEMPYTLANVWVNTAALEKHLPEMPFDESLAYTVAIGAALSAGPHAYV